jgi:hypothetical protein
MAGNAADLFYFQQYDIVVAVGTDFQHLLEVAGLLALVPKLPARARPVNSLAHGGCLLQRLAVHPGKHQHLAAGGILGDHGHQAVLVPLDFVQPLASHSLTSMPRERMYSLAWRTVYSP